MKILIFTPAIVGINPGLTGGEMRFIEIIKGWLQQGHEVHMLTSLGGKNLCESLGVRKCQYHIISESARETRIAFILRTLKILFTLPDSVKKDPFDILYSPSEQFYDVWPAYRLKGKLKNKTKWATVVHWLPPFPPWKRKSSTILNSTLFFMSERLGVRLSHKNADVLLPVSTSTRKQLVEVFGESENFKAVDCGVQLQEIQNITRPIHEKIYDAVFMKRLQAVKGIFDLIDIWEMVVAQKPDAQLAIIGSGIDGERARQIVKEKNLDKNIQFLGIIYDMNEKFTKIAQSRLFVLPTYEENWAIVIGEAMAAGVPVISYNLKELTEVWGDKYIPVLVGDKRQFAEKILDLLQKPEKMDTIRSDALEYIQKYDWYQISKNELNLISKSSC